MKILSCALLIMMPAFLGPQEKDEWRPIFKYEDGSVIELNASKVRFGLGDLAQVQFRLIWAKPESLKGISGGSYKTRIENVEFKCKERKFKRSEMTLLDPEGKPVPYKGEITGEWEEAKPKSIMIRVFDPACALIEETRRNPPVEN
jgi:hypothetical protein